MPPSMPSRANSMSSGATKDRPSACRPARPSSPPVPSPAPSHHYSLALHRRLPQKNDDCASTSLLSCSLPH